MYTLKSNTCARDIYFLNISRHPFEERLFRNKYKYTAWNLQSFLLEENRKVKENRKLSKETNGTSEI